METPDRELIGRIRQGDEAAFEQLAGRHASSLRRHLVAMVRDPAAAEDLLQEALLRLWTRAEQWEGSGSVRGWLRRTATNLALNHLRAARRRRERPLRRAPAEPEGEEEDIVPGWMIDTATLGPDAALEQAELRRRIRKLMDELPAEKREVLQLVYDEEADVEEAARRLRVPPGTVKSRLHYARKHLARKWTQGRGEET
jgi:RNA polymerase sigma-70 factor (ECF subfamily)